MTRMAKDGANEWTVRTPEEFHYHYDSDGALRAAAFAQTKSGDASAPGEGGSWYGDYPALRRMRAYYDYGLGRRLASVEHYADEWGGSSYTSRPVPVVAILDDQGQVSGYHDAFPMDKPNIRHCHDGPAGVEEERTVGARPGQIAQFTVTPHALGARGWDARYVSVSGAAETSAYPLCEGHGNMVGQVARAEDGAPGGSFVAVPGAAAFELGARRMYGAWGQARWSEGQPDEQGYCGNLQHRRDADTGLVSMRARYYEPWTGRFLSADPAMEGANWYVYCANDPVNQTDLGGTTAITAARGFLYFLFWLANTPFPSISDVGSASVRAMKIATFDPADFLNLTETEQARAFGLDAAAIYAPSIFSIVRSIITGRPPVGGAAAGVIVSGIVIGAELRFLTALYALQLQWYIDMAMES